MPKSRGKGTRYFVCGDTLTRDFIREDLFKHPRQRDFKEQVKLNLISITCADGKQHKAWEVDLPLLTRLERMEKCLGDFSYNFTIYKTDNKNSIAIPFTTLTEKGHE